MKTIGIACDDYKIDKFKSELEFHGFNNYEVKTLNPLVKKTSLIQVKCEELDISTLNHICLKVEGYFKSKRN